ncbi:MAG: PAS domain S-box protein [Thermoanaerobaculia bacterium]
MDAEGLRVLLIEDSPSDAFIIRQDLEDSTGTSFGVAHVETLHDALSKLGQRKYDALVLDLNLPDSQGLDSLLQLKDAATGTPIVVLSGNDDDVVALHAIRAAAQDYLPKRRIGEGVVARVVRYAIEREASARALRESEERFRATFEQAAVGIAHVSPTGRLLLVNDRFCGIVGYSREELIGMSFTELTVIEDIERTMNERDALLSGDTEQAAMEKRYRRKDGRTVWVSLATRLLRDAAGKPNYFITVLEDITRRKEAELRSRSTAERYRALFDRSLDGVFVCDLEGHFLDANPAALRAFGYSLDEIRSLDFSHLVTNDDDLARAGAGMRQILRTGSDGELMEFRLRRNDGSLIWVEVLSSLVLEEGKPVAVQGVFRETTERKRAAIALAHSEAQFRAIFERAGIGLAIVDHVDGTILRSNAALARMFGYDVEELRGMTVSDVSHPDDYRIDRETWDEMVEGTLDRFQMEKRYRRKDGSWMWGFLTSTLVRDDTGPRFIIGMLEDITERKLAEEGLRKAKETLQTIFDAAPVAILGLDLEGRVTEWNEGARRMFGWSPEEAIGRFCPSVPEEVREEFLAMIARVVGQGPVLSEIQARQKRNGERIQASISSGAIRDDAGSPVGTMVVLEDITERKRLEEQFLRAQRMESIGTLAGGIAHDLNNVLAPIMMSIDVLSRGETDPKRRETLARMMAGVRRGANMVKQVLAFARGVEGRRIEVDAGKLLSEIAKIVNDTFLKTIHVTTDISPDLWTVSGVRLSSIRSS